MAINKVTYQGNVLIDISDTTAQESDVFEGKEFYITKYWDEYLTKMYGNYMAPPPENARSNKHGVTKG
jgi:phosphorylcholine metabolism protein LicD